MALLTGLSVPRGLTRVQIIGWELAFESAKKVTGRRVPRGPIQNWDRQGPPPHWMQVLRKKKGMGVRVGWGLGSPLLIHPWGPSPLISVRQPHSPV